MRGREPLRYSQRESDLCSPLAHDCPPCRGGRAKASRLARGGSMRGRSSSVLSELWDAKSGNGAGLRQVQLQPEGGRRAEIQGDDADDESARRQTPRAAGAAQCSAPPAGIGAPPSARLREGRPRPLRAGGRASPPSKLKGTMVGVAPPMPPVMGKPGGASAPAPAVQPPPNYVPPPPNYCARAGVSRRQGNFGASAGDAARSNRSSAAPPAGATAAPQQQQRPQNLRRLPPQPQKQQQPPPPQQAFGGGQGVNPLGGTMAATDAGAFNPYGGAPPGGYGAPSPGGGGYAPPPHACSAPP